jgi:hypothetical protein
MYDVFNLFPLMLFIYYLHIYLYDVYNSLSVKWFGHLPASTNKNGGSIYSVESSKYFYLHVHY